jgi:biopolymer transport protein ExbD
MPHGSTEKCEPNFTPLLDLVLQLVMFFMLCANFVLEQASKEIELPKVAAAKIPDRSDVSTFYLDVNEHGKVLLSPLQRRGEITTLDNEVQVKNYMTRQAELERASSKSNAVSLLVLRVDRRTRFEHTYAIMRGCRAAGYENVSLRVEQAASE